MKVAQVSPLYESVPPACYGGTERVVSYLTEALVELGHDVTLFASGDSVTSAKLVPICPRALRLENTTDPIAYHVLQTERVVARASEFDIVHWHTESLHFPISRRLGNAQLTTLHGRLDLPGLEPVFAEFREMPVVSISDAQRQALPQARFIGTVLHGLPPDAYAFGTGDGGYFAFLGRISPEKRLDRAIAIARRLGIPLKVGAKVDRADSAYFQDQIEPLLDHPLVEFLGEIGEPTKRELLARARALLFPIDWPEPFGLVMIEAMACGTPVIAYRAGSVPEVMIDGVTGFIVDGDEAAVRAAARVHELDRAEIRRCFERRFTSYTMAARYLELYAKVLLERGVPVREVAA